MIQISLENGTVISIESDLDIIDYQKDWNSKCQIFEDSDCWISADYHLGKYMRYTKDDPKYTENIKNTEEAIKLHNAVVKKDDLVLFLGDLSESEFGDELYTTRITSELKKLIGRLNGKIIMLTGNNDTMSDAFYKSCGIHFVIRRDCLYTKNLCFSHFPVNVPSKGMLNIHGHIHGSKKYWGIDWKNHIDCYWKLWGGPKHVSDFVKLYNDGKYKATTVQTNANLIADLGEDAGYDNHK